MWLTLKGKQHLSNGSMFLKLQFYYDQMKLRSIQSNAWNEIFTEFNSRIKYALEILDDAPDINDQSIINFREIFKTWLSKANKMNSELKAIGLI